MRQESEFVASGDWHVDSDEHGVMLRFEVMSDDGIEVFETDMPRDCAIDLAHAILQHAEYSGD